MTNTEDELRLKFIEIEKTSGSTFWIEALIRQEQEKLKPELSEIYKEIIEYKYTPKELHLLLTDEFLALLAITVKTCGWAVDLYESDRFVRWAFDLAMKKCPDLTPYDENE